MIYQAYNRNTFDGELWCWGTTPAPLGPALKAEYPDIAETARFVSWGGERLVSYKEKGVFISGNICDPALLTIFGFPFKEGSAKNALDGIYSIVITEKMARKVFGDEPAMNKILKIDNKDNFKVTGVLKDLPNNTRFGFEYLLPWKYLVKEGNENSYWGNNSYQTYIELKPNVSVDLVNKKIKDITINHSNKEEDTEVFLHPAKFWHLYSEFKEGKIVGGGITYVRLAAIIAIFILLIACINFMNLSTARSEKRAKEVGIRKVVGAERRGLISQFLGESILMSAISFALAILLVYATLPSFNTLTTKQLTLDFANPYYWMAALIIVLLTGVLAGSYPAFYLSSFRPIKVLKGFFKAGNQAVTPRKVLVVIQFSFSIMLIISTIIVYKQIKHGQGRPSGYNRENLVFMYMTGDMGKNYELIRSELLNNGTAESICKTNSPVSQGWSDTWGVQWKGSPENHKIDFDVMTCSANFAKTMGMKLVDGRDIDIYTYKTDSLAMLVNESAVKVMGLKNPVGEWVKNDERTFIIVGVLKDFILRSPYGDNKPLLVKPRNWDNVITVRFNKDRSTQQNLAALETVTKKYNPAYPFQYQFVDDDYGKKFGTQQRFGTFAGVFSSLAIIISCLGLFGLATFTAENRIKEIGIRKVLGASTFNLTALLSKDFLRLVIIAFAVASPIAWWAMTKWLADYNYRITIGWWTFALAGLMAVSIALLTISYQAIKAALSNPVKSLKTE
ncbi:ABC transporter permease [Emticicia sp. C21]|uniref:ABC transporter permease n=1 Tax=Emticicia sp. C21 TaxID=2302915 RepID=UPI0038D3F6D7